MMRRFGPDDPIPADARGAAVALGNFDGVHRGHQGVLAAAKAAARARGLDFAAAVFEPHPRRHFQPDAPPFRLQSGAQRARALEAAGVETLYELRFDANLARLSDEAFGADILAARLGARLICVGFDFRYGRARAGDVGRLRAQGAAHGFDVEIVAPVEDDAHKISSTAIRAAIAAGAMEEAARLMGRPFAIEGPVLKGFQRGRGFGWPTANQALGDYQRPRFGVYATRSDLGDGVLRPGVASLGLNPTIGALDAPLLETYLFDFDGDLYGRTIETQLIAFLRPEAKFDTLDALKAQIAADAAAARNLLAAGKRNE